MAKRSIVDATRVPRCAWLPWIVLSVGVFLWGLPAIKSLLDSISVFRFPVDGLNNMIQRVPPVVAKPQAEAAVYILNWLSTTGTGLLISAVIAGRLIGASFKTMLDVYWDTLIRVRYSLLTIAAMLALGYTTRYSGLDATLGLAFAQTGVLYPFFGTLLGWIGVALTRAFFYAGARAFLVSHWEVDSDAAVKLTTRAFSAMKAHPDTGRRGSFSATSSSIRSRSPAWSGS